MTRKSPPLLLCGFLAVAVWITLIGLRFAERPPAIEILPPPPTSQP